MWCGGETNASIVKRKHSSSSFWINKALLYEPARVCDFTTNSCSIVKQSRSLLSILGFLRWRQSCAGEDSCTAEFSGSSSMCRCSGGSLLPASGAQRPCSKQTPPFIVVALQVNNLHPQNVHLASQRVILVWFLAVSSATAAVLRHGGRFTRHTHYKALCNVAHPACVGLVLQCTVGCPGLHHEFHTESTEVRSWGSHSQSQDIQSVTNPATEGANCLNQ